ncbi:hypothetical protein BDC45DRAFT_567266 [Circinella umbellata]|nr:hypothetical protein BDC45DRAFT_567266 [Circinella umbellata]
MNSGRSTATASSSSSSVPLPSRLPNFPHTQYFNRTVTYAHAAAAAQQTFQLAQESRPKNTKRTYIPKQEEFLDWCRCRCPANHTQLLIDDAKLHLFFGRRELPISTPTRPPPSSSAVAPAPDTIQSSSSSSAAPTTITSIPPPDSSEESVVAAEAILSVASSKVGLATALLDQLRQEDAAHKCDQMEDRGAGTVADGYSTIAEIKNAVDYYFGKNT